MKMKRTLQAMAVMAATGACFLSSKETTLTLDAYADGEELAGLELFIGGVVFPGLNARKFTATELLAPGALEFVVLDHGTATMTARLIEDGRIVAEGAGEWDISPEDDFELVVKRTSSDGYNTSKPDCVKFLKCANGGSLSWKTPPTTKMMRCW